MWILRGLLIIFFVLATNVSAVAQTLLRSDVPDWVDVAELPVMAPDLYRQVENGENFLLVDRQVRWLGSTKEIYIRVISEAVNRTGLEAIANVSRDFDPNIDSLTLVRLDTVRDGVRTALRDRIPEEIIRRETRFDQGILDGSLTALLTVPGVQVGDIVDTAFIWRSEEYYPGFNFSARYQLEYSVPVAMNRVVMHWPNDRSLALNPTAGAVEPIVQIDGDVTRYEWVAHDAVPYKIDENTPAEYDPWAAVEISGFESWSNVAAAFGDHYSKQYSVPQKWRERVDAIARNFDNDADRSFAALRLVQDEIRYVGLEVGAGGYFARSPQSVVENAYGDCKDKSLLLKTILQDLGVSATVALASLEQGYGVIDRLPSAQPFDHMIVGAQLKDGVFWMDPTASNQGGGYASAVQPDYGYVLPLGDMDETELVKITTNDAPRQRREMTENFWFTFAGAFLKVETEFLGESADWQRDYWAGSSLDEIANGYLTYYVRNYPGIQSVAPPRIEDDRGSNRVLITETYLIPKARLMALDLLQDFPFMSSNSYESYPDLLIGARRDPLAVPHSQKLVHNVRVRNAPIEFEAPEKLAIGGPAFDQSFTARAWEGGNMDMTWSFQSSARSVAANDVQKVISDAKSARSHAVYTWDLRNEGG